ncbi:CHASE2 domain-containing protein [Desulfurispirillum indicum]|uniref:CHASE2 domain-containing protein n=1 Tax=Desulfurispirillum indicum TaxID=936456 RepID=UPI001CFC3CCE|nr:CHASE2 domain-containing protein [Desulfurispirillum indicum]UCZ55468.1 CHASE2 domain-containing protein [Desulfurispirillum indicum]
MGQLSLKHVLNILSRRNASTFLAGVLFSLVMAALYIYMPPFLRIMDHKVYDTILKANHATELSDAVIIVDLDEKSLASYGQWPWPRYRVALLLEQLRRGGALAVGLDILFAEEDRTSPRILQQQLQRELGVSIHFEGLPPALEDNDAVLASILEQGPYTLGYFFDFSGETVMEEHTPCKPHPFQVVTLRESGAAEPAEILLNAPYVLCNIDIISNAATSSGFYNVAPDADGIIRRTPLVIYHDGEIYPSLGLSTLAQALGTRQVLLKLTAGGVESLVFEGTEIPLDHRGQMLLHYRGPGKTFTYYSAADVLDGSVPQGAFDGRMVLIGTSAAGLKDLRSTPFDTVYPGVEAHATVADTILQGDFLARPDWVPGLELLLVLALGVVSTVAITWTRSYWLLIPLLLCLAAAWFGSTYLFTHQGIYVSPMMPMLTLAANFSLLTLLKFWSEEKSREQIHGAFQHYLSPAFISELLKDPDRLQLGGEQRELTVLFSDIRSFTTISEGMSPAELVTFINEYLTAMTDIVMQRGGTLDKYLGDAIMAFFGAPLPQDDHALRGCRVALEMIHRLDSLRDQWVSQGYPPMHIGVGVNTGQMVVGNMGSQSRFDYTVMGDNVNLGSRLEGLTKSYGVSILISQSTFELVKDTLLCREIDLVQVKGKHLPVAIFEPLGERSDFNRIPPWITSFEEGLQLYRAQQWQEAMEAFERARELNAADRASEVFAQRCRHLQENPPHGEWNGVWVMTTK